MELLQEEFEFCIQDEDTCGIVNGELSSKAFDKGSAVKRLCEFLGISREDTIAFGDSMNDYEMMKYAAYSVTEDGSYIFVITADEDAALSSSTGNMKSSDEIVLISIFWGGIVMVICMVIVFFICDAIVRPLKHIARIAMKFAELDFREDQDQKKLSVKKDEIGAISRAVDTLRGHLCRVIGRIESHSATVMETSHMLSEDADSIFGTVKQVERAVQEMAKGSTSQAGETQQAMESIVLMGSMIEENSMEMEELHVRY